MSANLTDINGYYGRKILNFKNFDFQWCNAPPMKGGIHIELEKVGFVSRKR